MSRHIFSLLTKSARLQQEIAAARKRHNPSWLRVLRPQNLRLHLRRGESREGVDSHRATPAHPRPCQPLGSLTRPRVGSGLIIIVGLETSGTTQRSQKMPD